jgi:hypothetical protein
MVLIKPGHGAEIYSGSFILANPPFAVLWKFDTATNDLVAKLDSGLPEWERNLPYC